MREAKSKPVKAEYAVAIGDTVYHSMLVDSEVDQAEYGWMIGVYAKHWGLELIGSIESAVRVGDADLKALCSKYRIVDVEKFMAACTQTK